LVYLSILLFPNSCIILFWEFYRIIQNDCQGFNNLPHSTLQIAVYVFFHLT
jgi:hypothetical protein